MIKLFTQKEFKQAKTTEKLPLKCKFCSETFLLTKHDIYFAEHVDKNKRSKSTCCYCSQVCNGSDRAPRIKCLCTNCNKPIDFQPSCYRKSKNHFCSQSCSGTYNNTHKTKGTRRSKLEAWLEKQLSALYPALGIEFNSKSAIQSELDVYIPSLKLAFELNGIYHYEPIHGQSKLDKIKNNDTNKFKACITNNINLCLIDVSGQLYFKERTSQKYLDIIKQIIDKELGLQGIEP